MSFEKILSEKIHVRNKYGFRPPSTGRKTDVEGDPEVRSHPQPCDNISPLTLTQHEWFDDARLPPS